MARKTKKPTSDTAEARDAARAKAELAVRLWYVEALGMLRSIATHAQHLGEEVNRADSPLSGLFDPKFLEHISQDVHAAADHLANDPPAVIATDPLAGLKRS